MKKIEWFSRKFVFGVPPELLPFLIERLAGTTVRIEKKIAGLPDELLSSCPGGKWSIKQNIGHLAEVDEIALRRIDEMLQGISPMSPAVFEPRQDYNRQKAANVLQYFRQNRELNIGRYSRLDGHELVRASIHPRLKVPMTPVDLAYFDAEHDDHHLVRMNEIIQSFKTLTAHAPSA